MTIWHDGIEINNCLQIISHRGHRVRFRHRVKFNLAKHLILDVFNREELFMLLYGHQEDGGPEIGTTHISVLMSQMRPVLTMLGLTLRKEKGAHYWTRYHLVPTVSQIAEAA